MRIISRVQFDRPPIGSNVVTAEAMLPAGMIALSVHQWMKKIVLFIDCDEKAVAVKTPLVFLKTGAGPAPHPTTYAGSVIMVDNAEEWHLYFGSQDLPTKEADPHGRAEPNTPAVPVPPDQRH